MPKKGKKKKDKEPNDKFMEMEEAQLEEYISKKEGEIKETKSKRNFVQQERDMITNYYEISKDEEKKLKEAIEKEEVAMDYLNKEHTNEINAFENKYRHLEYDHDMFINDQLPKKKSRIN
jgi:hypothetical protein